MLDKNLTIMSILIPLMIKLRMLSFIALPGSGFLVGYTLQWLFGLRGRPKYESLAIHLITSVLWIILFSDIYQTALKSIDSKNLNGEFKQKYHTKDIALYVALCYLFILGCIIGLMSEII